MYMYVCTVNVYICTYIVTTEYLSTVHTYTVLVWCAVNCETVYTHCTAVYIYANTPFIIQVMSYILTCLLFKVLSASLLSEFMKHALTVPARVTRCPRIRPDTNIPTSNSILLLIATMTQASSMEPYCETDTESITCLSSVVLCKHPAKVRRGQDNFAL